jgi:circadian clock protein KaiC
MQHSANIGVPPRALAKAPTGIQGLDEITNGEEIASDVASLGFDLPALVDEGKLFIDYVRIERSEIEEAGEYDLEGLFVRLDHAIRSTGAKRIVLDSLESLFSGPSNANILRAELQRLFRWLKDKGLTAVITAERWEGTLTRQGLSVLPVTSLGLTHEASLERLPSGVRELDAMLGGQGYFRGSTVLVSGTAGTGKTSLAAHFANAACRRGERGMAHSNRVREYALTDHGLRISDAGG